MKKHESYARPQIRTFDSKEIVGALGTADCLSAQCDDFTGIGCDDDVPPTR